MPPIPYPLVNGARQDYSSVEVVVAPLSGPPQIFTGVKEVMYRHTLEPGVMRGTRAQVAGATRGKYDAEGSITFYKAEYLDFIRTLGPGYMEKFFLVTVHHNELPALEIITDVLRGCRLKTAENSFTEGGDASVVKCDLFILSLVEGGLPPLLKMPL